MEEVKPQGWGSKERMAMVAEVLRQRRMVEILVQLVVVDYGECPPNKHLGEDCKEVTGCFSCWTRWVEHAVAEEISPEEKV